MQNIEQALRVYVNPQKASFYPRFFKTGSGQYGEGDQFMGVTVPNQRKVAKQLWASTTLNEIINLLKSPLHECRLTALFMLILRFEHSNDKCKVIDAYIAHLDFVNNWDLVDNSAPQLLGKHLHPLSDRSILYTLASSTHLWRKRISIVSTLYFVKRGDISDALHLAEIHLSDEHDLMHKAVGWVLREVGKQCRSSLLAFIDEHGKKTPRTTLRYAIEHFSVEERARIRKNTK